MRRAICRALRGPPPGGLRALGTLACSTRPRSVWGGGNFNGDARQGVAGAIRAPPPPAAISRRRGLKILPTSVVGISSITIDLARPGGWFGDAGAHVVERARPRRWVMPGDGGRTGLRGLARVSVRADQPPPRGRRLGSEVRHPRSTRGRCCVRRGWLRLSPGR